MEGVPHGLQLHREEGALKAVLATICVKGTGIERLVPHADSDLVELMKKLVRRNEASSEWAKWGRYDPDERILARQALKDGLRNRFGAVDQEDPYFRELREAEKER